MRDFLAKNNLFQFDKISVNQILVISEILSEYSLLQKEVIEKQYQRSALNFSQTVDFLREIGLIEIIENQIVLESKYKQILQNLKESQQPRETIKKIIVDCLVTSKTSFSEYLNGFLSQFQLIGEQFEFTPSVVERLKYSGLRNFLIDLEFLYLDSTETKYVIVKDYSTVYAQLKAFYQLSPEEFLEIKHEQEEIGNAAELKIIEYEKERLLQFPQLAEKIEHIARYDVRAGYDVKSYEVPTQNGLSTPKYIEVKAVSIIDYQFNWSRNEIEKSGLYRQSYYLYLLPAKNKNEFDISHLKIINDPHVNVLNNSDEWTKTVESLAFSLKKDQKNF